MKTNGKVCKKISLDLGHYIKEILLLHYLYL